MIKGNCIRNLVETKYPIMKENSIFLVLQRYRLCLVEAPFLGSRAWIQEEIMLTAGILKCWLIC